MLLEPRRAWSELNFLSCLSLSTFSLYEHQQQVSQCWDHAAGLLCPSPHPGFSTFQHLSPVLPPSVVSFYCPPSERLVTLPGFSLSHLQGTWKASTDLVSPVSQPHPNILSHCRREKDNHVLRNACNVHIHQMLYLPDTQRHIRGTKQERERLFIAVGWLKLTCYSVSGTILAHDRGCRNGHASKTILYCDDQTFSWVHSLLP